MDTKLELEKISQKAFGNGYIAALSDVLKIIGDVYTQCDDKELLAKYSLVLVDEIAKQKEIMELNNFNYNYEQD